jgi:hypothetical protein
MIFWCKIFKLSIQLPPKVYSIWHDGMEAK